MKQLFTLRSILMLLLPFQFACNRPNETGTAEAENGTAALSVTVTRASSTTEKAQLQLSGSVEAETAVDIGFMVSGKVNTVAVQEGDRVRKGQLVASLDPRDYALGVEIANANMARIRDEYERLTIMNERGSLAPADYQKAVTALQEVQARQKLAAKNLQETKLYAPIAGIVARRGTDPGEIISQGMPLFSIVNIEPIKVRVSVPEAEIGQVALGQEAQVHIPALDSTFTGKISLIGAVADPAARAYTVKIDLPNPQHLLRPGMVAEANITSNKKVQAIAIPGEAILRDTDRQTYVFVVDRQKNQAFRRNVTVGRIYGNNIEITSGLNAGDLVVTGGQQRLNDAAQVRIVETAQK